MALSTLPPDEVAHYVHGSLERFTPRAVDIVKQRFRDEAAALDTDMQLVELDYDDCDDVHSDVPLWVCRADHCSAGLHDALPQPNWT